MLPHRSFVLALFPCKECQKDISSEASNCPNCGVPLRGGSPRAEGCAKVGVGCITVLIVASLIGQCSATTVGNNNGTSRSDEGGVPPGAVEISVWSDSKARYWELSRGGTSTAPTNVTRRVGPSGTSYAEREYDCSNHTFRYLAEGDSLAGMISKANERMSTLVEGSISDIMWHYVCGG